MIFCWIANAFCVETVKFTWHDFYWYLIGEIFVGYKLFHLAITSKTSTTSSPHLINKNFYSINTPRVFRFHVVSTRNTHGAFVGHQRLKFITCDQQEKIQSKASFFQLLLKYHNHHYQVSSPQLQFVVECTESDAFATSFFLIFFFPKCD